MITTINLRAATLATLCSTLAASGACTGGDAASDGDVEPTASAVYATYQAGTHDRVQFEVTALKRGALPTLASQPINDLVGVPDYWLRGEQNGTELGALVKEARAAADDEWAAPIDVAGFAAEGHRLEDGRYTLLGVRMSFEGQASEHRALQVCFDAEHMCTILDPVVLHLSDFAENRDRLLAEGWQVTEESVPAVPDESGLSRPCTLNSDPSLQQRKFSKPASWVEYKNVFRKVLVRKDLGAQEYGVSCYVNNGQCRSSGFGFSEQSSCYGRFGWQCACENTGNLQGTTGNATRAWSETRCTHKFLVKASVSFQVDGQGAGFDVHWAGSGGVDAQGGQIYDSCSFH